MSTERPAVFVIGPLIEIVPSPPMMRTSVPTTFVMLPLLKLNVPPTFVRLRPVTPPTMLTVSIVSVPVRLLPTIASAAPELMSSARTRTPFASVTEPLSTGVPAPAIDRLLSENAWALPHSV